MEIRSIGSFNAVPANIIGGVFNLYNLLCKIYCKYFIYFFLFLTIVNFLVANTYLLTYLT